MLPDFFYTLYYHKDVECKLAFEQQLLNLNQRMKDSIVLENDPIMITLGPFQLKIQD